MRVNVYSQELTDQVILLTKKSNTGITYTAAQLMLHSSPALHHTLTDDDRSAVTFWLPKSAERRTQMAQAFERIAEIFRTAPPETGLDSAAHVKHVNARNPGTRADPLAALWLLDNARPNAPGERAGAHVKTRVFFERLCDGSASVDDFDHVGMTINMCKVRALEIDETLADMLERAQDAMTACQSRYRRLGRFGFTGPELTHMRDAIDACEAIIDASSPLQMRSARRIAIDAVLGEKGAWRRIEAQFAPARATS